MDLGGRLGVLALVAASASCGEGRSGATAGDVGRWEVVPEPLVAIGGSDEREDYLLYGVVGATRLSDGRIVVANQGSSELKLFAASGVHERTVGGAGDGPGEMRGIFQLVPLPGDSLLVLSFRPGLSRFGPDGTFARSTPVDLWSVGGVECRSGEGNWYVLPDASLVTILEDNLGSSGCPPTPPSPWRQSGLIGRYGVETGSFDTLAILAATERNSPNYRVFGKSLLLGLATDRVYAGDTGSDVILALGLEGDTLATLPTPFEATPVPARARATEVRRFTRPDGSTELGNPYLYPEAYPRFGRLLVSRTGNLWVMAYPVVEEPISSHRLARTSAFLVEPRGARWRVLHPDGSPAAEVRTPEGVFLLEIGEDYVLGLSRDELDVETVGLYRLVR